MRSLIALFCYASIAAFGGPAYSVQAVPPPIGYSAVYFGINNSGQVTGYGTSSGGVLQALIGAPFGSAAIPLAPGYQFAEGSGINNAGQVVGTVGTATTGMSFVGTASGIALVTSPPFATASGINDSGQIVGYEFVGSNVVAFVGTVAGIAPVPLPKGWSYSQGVDINNAGQITGVAGQGNGPFHVFIGTASSITVLPLPSGFTQTIGFAINDSGKVSGWGFVGTGFQEQAFVGDLSGLTPIPLPPGATTAEATVQSINNSGIVVGGSDTGGWIWDATHGTRLLNGLVPSGWNVEGAISISSSGLILAVAALNGGPFQYVELAPAAPVSTPGPTTWMLVVIGLGLLPVIRRFARRTI